MNRQALLRAQIMEHALILVCPRSPYQNCVTVGTHSGAEPLAGLEISLVLCVIELDGTIAWEKYRE